MLVADALTLVAPEYLGRRTEAHQRHSDAAEDIRKEAAADQALWREVIVFRHDPCL